SCLPLCSLQDCGDLGRVAGIESFAPTQIDRFSLSQSGSSKTPTQPPSRHPALDRADHHSSEAPGDLFEISRRRTWPFYIQNPVRTTTGRKTTEKRRRTVQLPKPDHSGRSD